MSVILQSTKCHLNFPCFLVLLLVFQRFSLDIPPLNHDDDDYEGLTLQALSPITEIDLSTLENGYLDDKQITSVEIKLKKDSNVGSVISAQ